MIELPILEVIIVLVALLVAILVVQIMTLRVLKSFQAPQETQTYKEQMDDLHFKDVR